MRRPDNPYFSRAIVNRVWAHYFGRGIVDPPDDLSPLNPPSHPELLDELATRFISSGFDLRWLHRVILSTRTYQQSSSPSTANRLDRTNYAYFYVRRLEAEVVLDALDDATGTTENFGMQYYHWPQTLRNIEVPYPPEKNEFVCFMLEQFGRPERNSAIQCDCERIPDSSILQVLSLTNHPRIWAKITASDGRAAKIVKQNEGADACVDAVFLSDLGRPPADSERSACLQYLETAATREQGVQGLMWSLLNTKEFLLQH